MTRTTANRPASVFLWIAGLMLILVPFVRLAEAGFRFVFMRDHYGSFGEALKRDIWFSEGWIAYVKTPLGLTMTVLPLVLVFGSIFCFVCAARSRSRARRGQSTHRGTE